MPVYCADNMFGRYWFNTYPETKIASYAEVARTFVQEHPSLYVGYILGNKERERMEWHGHKILDQFQSDEGVFAEFNEAMQKKGHMPKALAKGYYRLSVEENPYEHNPPTYETALKKLKDYNISGTDQSEFYLFDRNHYLFHAAYPVSMKGKNKVLIQSYQNMPATVAYTIPGKNGEDEYPELVEELFEFASDHRENLPNHHIFWIPKKELVKIYGT